MTRLSSTLALALAALGAGAALAQPTRLPLPPESPPVAPYEAGPLEGSPSVRVISGAYTLHQREERLEALLKSSVADGSLGRHEYARAGHALEAIRATEDRVRRAHHGELSDTATFRLEGRLRTLAASIRWKH